MHRPFTLYTRKNSKGKNIYYARFRDRHGLRTSGISTGQTSKVRAETWASEYLTMLKSGKGNVPTIKKWGEDFFLKSEGWILSVKSKGKSVTPRYCRDVQTRVDMHIIPFLGHIKLSSLVQADVVDFRTHLYKKGYQGSTINHILSTLRTMLNYAVERGIIDSIPTIERVSTTDQANRGILTPDEAQRLFLIEWEDQRAYTANLLSAVTGMRSGEVLALQCSDVQGDYIDVKKSFDWTTRKIKNSTKTGRSRVVPLPNMIRPYIAELIELNPWEEKSFLFCSLRDNSVPVDRNNSVRGLKKALQCIGIDEAERKRRNITFHSWRHFFNSFLINKRVPVQKVQQLTGHSTLEMSEHYYHVDSMEDVRQLQERIIEL